MPDPFISSEKKAAKPGWYCAIGKYEQPGLGSAIWHFYFSQRSSPAGFMKKRHSAVFAECHFLFGSIY
jgi:hypothetical protein